MLSKSSALQKQNAAHAPAQTLDATWRGENAGSFSGGAQVVSDSESEEYRNQLYSTGLARPHNLPASSSGAGDGARNLSSAVRRYARQHQDEFPTNFDQVMGEFSKEAPAPQADQFELLYQGSRKDLAGVPEQAVALMRERQPWATPSGKLARIYVMTGGNLRIVESDDNFASWEAAHVIPPPAP